MPNPDSSRNADTDATRTARPPAGGKIMRFGGMVCLCSLVLIFVVLVVPLGEYAKYPVTFGLAALLTGLSCILNGLIDKLRGK